MVNKPKIRGTAWETQIVKALNRAHWPHAERRALQGGVDKGDIAGVVGAVIEAKDCKSITLGPWLKEAHVERDNAKASVGVVWAKRRGFVEAEDGYVVMDGRTFMALLHQAGY